MSLLESSLCEGRTWARVNDFFEVTRKPRSLDLSAHATVPFVPMEAVPQGGYYEPRYDVKPIGQLTSGTYFERGDLLIAKITPSFENGKQALADQMPAQFGYATTEVIPLRPRVKGHDKRLLFFYLLHPEIRSFVAERMEGSTGRQRVPESVLLELPYPMLPTEEQRIIADILERVCKAIEVEDRAANSAFKLKHAAMRELFTHGLRGEPQKETEIGLLPESWAVLSLGSLGKIGNGTTPNRRDAAYWRGGTTPWITSGRMYERHIVGSDLSVTDTALKECSLPLVQPGALLIAIVGQGKTLGHCAILGVKATVSRHVGFVQPDESLVSAKYLRGYLESQYEYLRQLASGNGSTRGALTCAILRALKVPLPELTEQQEMVSILEAIDCKIDLHQRKRAILDDLFKALLHKLMTGEIAVDELDLSALDCAAVFEGLPA